MTLEEKTVKALILSQLTIESFEEIKNTTLYKQNIKRIGNKFLNEIGFVERLTDQLYHKDSETLNNATRITEELISDIAKCSISDIVMIKQIHDYYRHNEDAWKELYELEFEKVDK